MALLSSRSKGFQDAYQLGSFVVLPVIFLVIMQTSGVIYFNLTLVFLVGLFIWLLDELLIWRAAATSTVAGYWTLDRNKCKRRNEIERSIKG